MFHKPSGHLAARMRAQHATSLSSVMVTFFMPKNIVLHEIRINDLLLDFYFTIWHSMP